MKGATFLIYILDLPRPNLAIAPLFPCPAPLAELQFAKKYLILLNEPQKKDPFLFVKTTSQKKNKPESPGCNRPQSVFFIPARKTYFILDTWVQLYQIYPILPQAIKGNPDIQIAGALNSKITQAIVDCLFESEEENLSPIIINLLRPPMQSD
jgi:hypothetical protein